MRLILAALLLGGPIQFASQESKTAAGGTVYNRVAFRQEGARDIWMMQQSHAGLQPPHEAWDRLAIVVDREKGTARFYQLEPGALAWKTPPRPKPFRVACFLCHANGPRAIRPASGLPWRERLRILAWNLRIKTYGRLRPDPENLKPGAGFRSDAHAANERLPARVCALCHNERSWGRGPLLRQHFMPIRFMVEQGYMPPPGFPLLESDRRAIADFLRGH